MYKDITSYKNGDKEKNPRVLENTVNGIPFTVHKHVYYGNEWLLSCDKLNADKITLGTNNMEIAKEKAIDKMIELLDIAIVEYKTAIIELKEQTRNRG